PPHLPHSHTLPCKVTQVKEISARVRSVTDLECQFFDTGRILTVSADGNFVYTRPTVRVNAFGDVRRNFPRFRASLRCPRRSSLAKSFAFFLDPNWSVHLPRLKTCW